MNAPHLNRALVLEGVVRTPDGAGGFTSSWTALGTLWAEVLPGSGSDTLGEERMLSAVPYRITVRGRPSALRPARKPGSGSARGRGFSGSRRSPSATSSAAS
jgi:head-tail adaptor